MCHFFAVCLTVFLFKFRPRTFTITLYRKKIRSELIISAVFLKKKKKKHVKKLVISSNEAAGDPNLERSRKKKHFQMSEISCCRVMFYDLVLKSVFQKKRKREKENIPRGQRSVVASRKVGLGTTVEYIERKFKTKA